MAADKDKKKICFVTTTPLIVNFFLTDIIVKLDHYYNVCLIVNIADGITFRNLPNSVHVLHVRIERKISPFRDFIALYHLARIFYSEKYMVVHSFSPKAGLLAMLAAWIVHIPFRIHTFQGEVWLTKRRLMRFVLKTTDKLTAWCSTNNLVISPSERKFLLQNHILSEHKSTVLAEGSVCGVDVQKFDKACAMRSQIREKLHIASNEVVFLYLGRMTRDKGVIDLANAFKLLREKYTAIRLLCVGPDEEKLAAQIQQIVQTNSCQVDIYGYTDIPEEFMAAADIVCLPSYREGFGMVLIEAGAAQRPVIASRIYGVTDAVSEGKTALLHQPGNINELYLHMEYLVREEQQRTSMGKYAREWVAAHYNQERVLQAYVDYYQGL